MRTTALLAMTSWTVAAVSIWYWIHCCMMSPGRSSASSYLPPETSSDSMTRPASFMPPWANSLPSMSKVTLPYREVQETGFSGGAMREVLARPRWLTLTWALPAL